MVTQGGLRVSQHCEVDLVPAVVVLRSAQLRRISMH